MTLHATTANECADVLLTADQLRPENLTELKFFFAKHADRLLKHEHSSDIGEMFRAVHFLLVAVESNRDSRGRESRALRRLFHD